MKKTTSKNRGKDKYTITEVGTLVEGFQSEFRVFGEEQRAIIKKLDATYEQTGKNTEKITLLETAVKDLIIKVDKNTEKIESLDKKIGLIETAVKDLAAKIDKLVESINELIRIKSDRQELQTLEMRVKTLETKIASLIQ